MSWLASLAGLGHDDLMRVSRLVELLAHARRADGDTARRMLDAGPEAASVEDVRQRVDTVIAFLEDAVPDPW